jgi:hypothetical protein
VSYPENLIWGTGAPKFYIGEIPGAGGRALRGVDGGEGYDASIISPPHPAVIDIQFQPVRKDGGDIEIALSDGQLFQREDGYRLALTLQWTNLTASQFAQVLKVYNAVRRYSVYVQPHSDVALTYEVGMARIAHALTGNLYLAHDATLIITGSEILPEVPSLSNATDAFEMIF